MEKRVVTAGIALAIFLPFLFLGKLPFAILVTLMSVIGVYELFRMHKLEIKSFEGILAIIGTIVMVFPFAKIFDFLPQKEGNLSLFFLVVMILLSASVISKNVYSIEEAAFPVIVSLYVGFGFHALISAREKGLETVFFALFLVWATDIGAYVFGQKYGQRKLCPEISPNKTIEGMLGGLIFAFLVAIIFIFLFPPLDFFNHSAIVLLLLSVLFSFAGQLGDLVESSFKRHFGIKDSGNLLPGHGGILDRFDSLLFVLPLMHLCEIF
ncbi:MAG: phosphatidate cytidylyltransferase [Lactobacillales bacterium]|jgi:phosphatidate cytidylyltransferase|nr:phosphatidate cytidylyltransferase [Lactobacillales bacterium]